MPTMGGGQKFWNFCEQYSLKNYKDNFYYLKTYFKIANNHGLCSPSVSTNITSVNQQGLGY